MQGGARPSFGIPTSVPARIGTCAAASGEDSVDCDHTVPFTAVICGALQLFDVSRQNIRAEFGVVQNAPGSAFDCTRFPERSRSGLRTHDRPQLDEAHVFSRPIVTQVVPFHGFYPAEMYHQHYLQSHFDQPYVVYNDLSKLAALKKQYPQMCKR